ncbi:MAG: glycoside hydrolase family 3 protein [Bacteroidetes bacterium]|nr:glycoside hydrolase family 3 protein [Bacteroidota bacterium]
MNLKHFILLSSVLLGLLACSQPSENHKTLNVPQLNGTTTFQLSDFLGVNKLLDEAVEEVFRQLDDTAIVAQLLMPAVGRYGQTLATIEQHIDQRVIGGILMLNGTQNEFTQWITKFNALNESKANLPFLYSADAEPSLVNRKIGESAPVKKAAEINSMEEVISVAQQIAKLLNSIGINYNFAPVVDVAGNATVGYRGFGNKPEQLIPWSNAFIQETQNNRIIATAKHFPGHGLVSGDTHASLQTIDGELKEIKNYPELISKGVLSIMVAHIAVKNNKKYDTQGLPSTCSKTIVTGLLKNELGFKGLIVTDAMNMGGVVNVPQSATKAISAGCDIILMPVNAAQAHNELLQEYRKNKDFQQQVNEAAKKVMRMKICLGLLSQVK